jgi:hypothetical protein
MLPRLISGGAQHLKPICTHDKQIDDFCSFRGLLVMIGARAGARPDGHLFASDDGKQGLWFGDIDDLWKLGKPRGHGGPWRDAQVAVGEPSDPYLMTGYDQITVELSHDGKEPIAFTVEVDFLADGSWSRYDRFTVPPGKTFTHKFPTGYSARWVRLTVDKPAKVTATFRYE